jgi:hypothetical protein
MGMDQRDGESLLRYYRRMLPFAAVLIVLAACLILADEVTRM